MPRWLTVTIVTLCIAYYLYIPISDQAGEPWKQHFTYAVFKVMGDISRIAELFGVPPINTIRNLLSFFDAINWIYGPKINDVVIKRDVFDGIEVRLYYPPTQTNELQPAVIYFHGGGWTYCDGDNYELLNKRIAKMANVITIYVEYRKAPEHIFPAAFDDCVKASLYVFKNAEKLGINKNRIGIAGDSAGGNLALAVSLKLTDDPNIKIPPLRMLGLVYPTVQALDFTLNSFETNNAPTRMENTFVTKSLMIFWINIYAFGHLKYQESFFNNSHLSKATKQLYRKFVDPMLLPEKYRSQPNDDIESTLPKEVEKVLVNPYYAPLMMSDEQMRKLPKSMIMTCGVDGLRDEGFILAERMRRANIPVKHHHYDGADHPFLYLTYYDVNKQGVDDLTSYIKKNI